MDNDKKMPTSRAGRTAVLGRLAAGQAARHAGAKLSTVGRSDDRKKVVMDRRQAEALRALVDALGLMRGGAMKIGQTLSMFDAGLVPEEMREEFQQSMAELRDRAPAVSFAQMRKLIESEIGPIEDAFAELDETPVGAASIGQVYRGRLHDGRDVAVKVQYPGIDKAVRADLKNLGLVMRALKMIAPGLDTGALADEIRESIEEELDYELEAQNQRSVARLYVDHPFIVIPQVISSLSGQHVLVSEYFDGARFDEIVDTADQPTRDRIGEIVFRFYCGSLYRHRQFSPDPHPGNFLVADDGRVAFLDFGLYRHVDAATLATQTAILVAVFDRDAEQLHGLLAKAGFLPDPDRVEPALALAYLNEIFGWMAHEGPLTMSQDLANEAIIQTANPSSEYFAIARHQQLPSEFLFVVRMIVMVMAAVGQLGATASWNDIACEWVRGTEPTTELGLEEARHTASVAVPSP